MGRMIPMMEPTTIAKMAPPESLLSSVGAGVEVDESVLLCTADEDNVCDDVSVLVVIDEEESSTLVEVIPD